MAEQQSSMISGFQILNYKVDTFQVKNQPRISSILNTLKPEDRWSVSIGLRKPTFYKKDLTCLGGLRILLLLHSKDIDVKDKNKENALISLECSIVGLFKIIDLDDYKKQTKQYEDLIKYQLPAILLPFLRATIISYFANAGYGSFIFPLINVLQVAQEQKIEIEYID